MKKKLPVLKTGSIATWLRVAAAVLCLGALFVPFSTGLKSVVSSDTGSVKTNYGPAFAFIFGGQISTGRITYTANGVAIIATIGFVFLFLAFASLIFQRLFFKTAKPRKALILSSAIASFVSAIMMLSAHGGAATVLADSILGRRSDSVVATMTNNTTLEFGFWGVSLFAFIAGTLLLASFIFDGTVDELYMKVKGR